VSIAQPGWTSQQIGVSGNRRLQSRIKVCRGLKFLSRSLLVALSLQSQTQLIMSRRIPGHRADSRTKLRNGALDVPGTEKSPS